MTLIINPGQNIEGTYYFDNIDFPTIVPQQTYSFDELVWSDECNGSGSIDTNKWFHQTLYLTGLVGLMGRFSIILIERIMLS